MAINYDSAAALFNDPVFESRAKAAINEQARFYAVDPDPAKSGMARGILGGNDLDEQATFRQITVTETGGDMTTDDAALLGAVQSAWALVAPARYGGEFVQAEDAPLPDEPVVNPQARKRS